MQVPAPFQYERATSVDHALILLAKYGPEARVVAGGHSLLPMMKLRLAQPEALVDINDLAELGPDPADRRPPVHRRDGPACPTARLPRWPASTFAILRDAERVIADPIVRNRGTVGGFAVARADPSEDLSAVFCAVRAAVDLSRAGTVNAPCRRGTS